MNEPQLFAHKLSLFAHSIKKLECILRIHLWINRRLVSKPHRVTTKKSLWGLYPDTGPGKSFAAHTAKGHKSIHVRLCLPT